MMENINNILIPDGTHPRITVTAPTVGHWDVGDQYETGVQEIKKIRGR